MVSAVRVGGVVSRRISAAMKRGDYARAGQLQVMLTNLNHERATAGQVLIDLQIYAKVVRKAETVIRGDRKQLKGGLNGK